MESETEQNTGMILRRGTLYNTSSFYLLFWPYPHFSRTYREHFIGLFKFPHPGGGVLYGLIPKGSPPTPMRGAPRVSPTPQ